MHFQLVLFWVSFFFLFRRLKALAPEEEEITRPVRLLFWWKFQKINITGGLLFPFAYCRSTSPGSGHLLLKELTVSLFY